MTYQPPNLHNPIHNYNPYLHRSTESGGELNGKIANHVVTNIGQWKRHLEQEAAAVEHSNVYLALACENSQHRNLTFALVTICDYLCLPKFQRGRCRVFHAE